MELTTHQLKVQSHWNQQMNLSLATDRQLDSEDYYSICLGFCIGNGCTSESAHKVASHPDTEL